MATQPYKTYGQYFANNPEAQKLSGYSLGGADYEQTNKLADWSNVGGNPYRFSNEYNNYLKGLPEAEGLLAGTGIDPSAVQSGAVTGVYSRDQNKTLPVGFGTPEGAASQGSSHMLSPDILAKMWR